MAWNIRPAGPGDVDGLLEVNAVAASAALPRYWLKDPSLYSDDRRVVLVAESVSGRLDALCMATLVLNEASLLLIVIRPLARGEGLGRSLLQALLDRLVSRGVDTCLLEVRETNTRALALYHGCGFVRDGLRKGYYPSEKTSGREDAILMSWTKKSRTGNVEAHAGT